MEVQMVKLENKGVNPTQVGLGLAILANSALTLYYIPKAALDVMPGQLFFRLNLLLIGVIIGSVFVGQSISAGISKFYLGLFLKLVPSDRVMGPLIYKNLESHQLKNVKANLMYCMTICFLVFSGTNFISISNYCN